MTALPEFSVAFLIPYLAKPKQIRDLQTVCKLWHKTIIDITCECRRDFIDFYQKSCRSCYRVRQSKEDKIKARKDLEIGMRYVDQLPISATCPGRYGKKLLLTRLFHERKRKRDD